MHVVPLLQLIYNPLKDAEGERLKKKKIIRSQYSPACKVSLRSQPPDVFKLSGQRQSKSLWN